MAIAFVTIQLIISEPTHTLPGRNSIIDVNGQAVTTVFHTVVQRQR